MDTTESHGLQKWRVPLAAAGFFLVAGFLLFTEHRAHVIAALPWLILLACPLLHVFMHGGHGGHGPTPGSEAGDHPTYSAPREDRYESR